MNRAFFLVLFLCVPSLSSADMVIGGEVTYRVVKGDTLELIAARLGVDEQQIVKRNNLDPKKPLRIGREITADTRKIVPKTVETGIIINIPDRMLYFFREGRLDMAFPVGLGMPSWRGMTRWRTPVGAFRIRGKQKNPTWHVPPSMQWQMMMEGKPVRKMVPPGPDNPLGRFAVMTSIRGIVIHETIWPSSVYQYRSHGCIRVLPEDIEVFFEEVALDTPGEILYMPVKLAATEEGRVLLEVRRDIYRKVKKDMESEVRRRIGESGLADRVDWLKVERVLREKTGVPEDITL